MFDFPRWKVWLVTLTVLAGMAAERPNQPRP
jgi:hypothetical protein